MSALVLVCVAVLAAIVVGGVVVMRNRRAR
jgi:hypothetical protein